MAKRKLKKYNYDFDVALSFASENIKYVKKVAEELKKSDIRVFFANDEQVNLWGKNLYTHFDDVFREKSRYVVIFLSKHYAKKMWTNHERECAQAKAVAKNNEYILLTRFDNTQIKGVLPTIHYIDLNCFSPDKLAKLIQQKLGSSNRNNFCPDNVERLFKYLDVRTFEDKMLIETALQHLFNSLKLMTDEERKLIWIMLEYCCSVGKPNNIHISLEVLKRLTKLSKRKIIAIFSRLKILGFSVKVRNKNFGQHYGKEIKVIFKPLFSVDYGKKTLEMKNSTKVLFGVHGTFTEHLCPECRENAFKRVDFSILNDNTYSER